MNGKGCKHHPRIPSLIIELCKHSQVPIEENEEKTS